MVNTGVRAVHLVAGLVDELTRDCFRRSKCRRAQSQHSAATANPVHKVRIEAPPGSRPPYSLSVVPPSSFRAANPKLRLGVIENVAICPIAFNAFEELKAKLGWSRGRRPFIVDGDG